MTERRQKMFQKIGAVDPPLRVHRIVIRRLVVSAAEFRVQLDRHGGRSLARR